MKPVDVAVVSSGEMGYWSVVVSGFVDGELIQQDISMFRGVPITIESLSWTDPFGPETAQLSIPTISIIERLPGADTWWLRRGTSVEIRYNVTNVETMEAMAAMPGNVATNADGIPARSVLWEGYVASKSYNVGSDGVGCQVECSGAMRILDKRVSPQINFSQPHPYEWVIGRHFSNADETHPTGLSGMRTVWPDWWDRHYKVNTNLPDYLQPAQVADGYPWTGMTTREFGRWDEVLSSTIQSLLSVMFTERGQFTLMLDPGRVPVLKHRDHKIVDDESTLHIDAVWPGVEIAVTEDDSQTVNVIYGEARSAISGASYRGLHYNIDGSSSGFDPFEVHGSVDPMSVMQDPSEIRSELYVNFSDGMTPADSIEKAHMHIQRNSTAGLTGTISLTGLDPLVLHPDGEYVPFPASAVVAGDSIRVHGLLGNDEGMLFHIAKTAVSPNNSQVTLTVDTKFRDFMTVREIMDRGRDALRPWHMMTVGKYVVNIPDAVMRWNYAEGSGYIPYEAFTGEFWTGAPRELRFPWTDWTTLRPPKEATWKHCYIKVPAIQLTNTETREADAEKNWNRPESIQQQQGCFVLLSQAGEISLLQIAAYDADGNVKKIPFHASIWASNAASSHSSPLLHEDTLAYYTDSDGVKKTINYKDGKPYPFFEHAWEQILDDGSQGTWMTDAQPTEDGLLVGYGNYWEKAGYWPGQGRSDVSDTAYPDQEGVNPEPTGLLVDESGWSFDMSEFAGFSFNDPSSNVLKELGNATILIYCESDTDTYFLGRLFRKEYGV